MRSFLAASSSGLLAILVVQLSLCVVESFLPQILASSGSRRTSDGSFLQQQLHAESSSSSGRGFAAVAEQNAKKSVVDAAATTTKAAAVAAVAEPVQQLRSMPELKAQLLELLPRMMGAPEEFRTVESLVNQLESMYTPPQTLDFLNFAMGGSWQLLFSTQLTTAAATLRLTELVQSVQPEKLKGSVVNTAQWDSSSMGNGIFDCSGTFSVVCSYSINQGGARMVMSLEDHKLELKRGSKVPPDVPALVGMLYRSMPTELFDPNNHAMDTTYLDENVRIVRMTGPTFEGVRNIFIRQGSMEINPVETK